MNKGNFKTLSSFLELMRKDLTGLLVPGQRACAPGLPRLQELAVGAVPNSTILVRHEVDAVAGEASAWLVEMPKTSSCTAWNNRAGHGDGTTRQDLHGTTPPLSDWTRS